MRKKDSHPKTNLNQILLEGKREIGQTKTEEELEKVRVKFLGRKGVVRRLLVQIKNQPLEKRKAWGKKINQIKRVLQEEINFQKKRVVREKKRTKRETSLYQLKKYGHLHPLTLVENQINNLFRSIGFSIYTGPEIETDEYCFRRLNVPPDHPARDLQDTIYIKEPEILLSTQTSSIEAHLLENETPPFRAAFPGRVYRNEKVTKSNHLIFHQYQGVAVDRDISLKDLIGVFDFLFKNLYGKKVVTRYRCKYYPEVEPGLGLDLRCFNCQGKGCPLCKGVGWIEMGGAGIIHPQVMEMAGIDPRQWRGFAFGLGLDRWVMAKYNIKDIRTLTGGNLAYKPNMP